MGRSSKIDIILENLDQIKILKSKGIKDVDIAEQLNICPATWYKHLKECTELQQAVKQGKIEAADVLESELFRRAQPHTLTTTKTIKKNGEVITETITKEVDGDLSSILFLLKNYVPEKFCSEPRMVKLKEQELELKKTVAENNNWLSLEEEL